MEESKTKGKKAKFNEDDDGFTTVKTRKFKWHNLEITQDLKY